MYVCCWPGSLRGWWRASVFPPPLSSQQPAGWSKGLCGPLRRAVIRDFSPSHEADITPLPQFRAAWCTADDRGREGEPRKHCRACVVNDQSRLLILFIMPHFFFEWLFLCRKWKHLFQVSCQIWETLKSLMLWTKFETKMRTWTWLLWEVCAIRNTGYYILLDTPNIMQQITVQQNIKTAILLQ